jgi:hypothetical protein
MKRILRAVSVVAALAAVSVWAQPGRGGGMGMSANMAKFFGDNKAFTAKVVTSMDSPSGPMTMEMDMAMLDGKMRMQMDMTKMKGGSMPPGAVAQMKQMGMDKNVNIVRPDKKVTYTIFPNLHAFAATTMTDKQVADAVNDSKIEKTSLGKETLDGHSCEKEKLTVTGANGDKHDVLVWNATDLKNFPIQMQMEDHGTKMTMKYTDIKLEKPDANLFDPPTDFTKYDSTQALMQTEVMKKMGPGGAPR